MRRRRWASGFWRLPLLMLLGGLCAGCDRAATISFAGEAQGTTYHVTVVPAASTLPATELQRRIEQRLAAIDKALSNYRDDSELAAFNRAPAGEWVVLGEDFYQVLKISDQISRESGGAFDITVAPLLSLWGFGPRQHGGSIPADAEIERVRAGIGYQFLELDSTQPRARKSRPLQIDVNGIAQGYSVDQLAQVLAAAGCRDFLVELGGELRMSGRNPAGKPWRIGIETPGDGGDAAQQALSGTGIAITTAGDYRDYFEKDGVRYSHTIDPRSGRPIAHRLASVTVIAADATLADGYDTVLEVLGPEAGMDFAQRHGIAAYFITRTTNGFVTAYTEAMSPHLQ